MSLPENYLERIWDGGQRHLAAGRYVAARQALEAAEAIAWRRREAATLARVYLPLMEARRLLRHQAAGGVLVIAEASGARFPPHHFARFLKCAAGTVLLPAGDWGRVATVEMAGRRGGAALEVLVLVRHGGQTRLVSPADLRIAAGLPVRFSMDAKAALDPVAAAEFAGSGAGDFAVPLPPAGIYDPADSSTRALHALAMESLLVAWETLALRWQSRHPLPAKGPSQDAAWRELAWLRQTLQVDPACEPAAMRLITLAESVGRAG